MTSLKFSAVKPITMQHLPTDCTLKTCRWRGGKPLKIVI